MPPPSLLDELLAANDRDRAPGARALVSWREDDEAATLAALDQRAHARVELERRGVWHGRVAALEKAPADGRADRERWSAARPIARPRLLQPLHADDEPPREELRTQDGLARWAEAGLGAGWQLEGALPATDPERDLARLGLRAPTGESVWLKSARLSTHPDDRSLRLRCSFGEERADDATHAPARDAAVRALAEALLPSARLAHIGCEQASQLAREALVPCQHIAYWNAPGGGALFHHDAFDEPHSTRQRGVLYVQLSGATLWLALSTADLVQRVREFGQALEELDMPWVAEALVAGGLAAAQRDALMASSDEALAAELALPGCGALAPLVNLGPDFTSLLVDAGHAQLLEAGDAILLPNHGYARTAYHSVWCASPGTAFGLSMALRRAD